MKVVVKMGGNVVKDPAQVTAVAHEVSALRRAGHDVAIVHGGGPQLDDAVKALGEEVQKIDGLRVTSERAAKVVEQVMDAIGSDLSTALEAHRLPAHHVSVGRRAFSAQVKDLRLGRVGTVTRFRAELQGLPVITPVGFDQSGPLNVNADEGAAAVASHWKADWLILATDVTAVRGASGESLERLTTAQAQALIGGPATGGMIPKLGNATSALKNGVGHVLITKLGPGVLEDSILKGKPHGTLVVP